MGHPCHGHSPELLSVAEYLVNLLQLFVLPLMQPLRKAVLELVETANA
jgi:hypothetical protein